jgi:hypothetical protein
VVIWSAAEPRRTGEVLFAPESGMGVFGRASSQEAPQRVSLTRQRPGLNVDCSSPVDTALSRKQLGVLRDGDGLVVTALGKQPMFVDGVQLQRCRVVPGQVVQLGERWQLLCAVRPLLLPEFVFHEVRFGRADAFELVGESAAMWGLRRAIEASSLEAPVLVSGPAGVPLDIVVTAVVGARRAHRVAASALVSGVPDVGDAVVVIDGVDTVGDAGQARLIATLVGRSGVVATASSSVLPALEAAFAQRIEVPGLDERRSDVPLLARHVLRSWARAGDADARRVMHGGAISIAPSVVRALVGRAWPNNDVGLAETMRRCLDVCEGDEIAEAPE